MGLISYQVFIDSLIRLLGELFPEDPPKDTPELRLTLEAVIAKANDYAIFEDGNVARYACLAYLLAPDFDTCYPTALSILIGTRGSSERLTELESWAGQMLELANRDR